MLNNEEVGFRFIQMELKPWQIQPTRSSLIPGTSNKVQSESSSCGVTQLQRAYDVAPVFMHSSFGVRIQIFLHIF
jgi:hypothetical protein